MSLHQLPENQPDPNSIGQPDRVEYDVGIESLVLHGVALSPSQAQEFRGALEAELATRLGVPGARDDLIHNAAMGPLTIHLESTDSPTRIAQSVAGSLFQNSNTSGLQ